MTNPQTQLIPVTVWPEHHFWPSVPGLRYLIFNAKRNGFDAVIRRIGRRVLIDEAAFYEWASAGRKVEPISPKLRNDRGVK